MKILIYSKTITKIKKFSRTKSIFVSILTKLHKLCLFQQDRSINKRSVRKNTESDREYRNGHRIGQRIPKRPPNRPKYTETATESSKIYRNGHRIGSRTPNRSSISVFKCENTQSDGQNSHVISLTYSFTLFP